MIIRNTLLVAAVRLTSSNTKLSLAIYILTHHTGAGNIGEGEGTYADGSVVREGPVGESGRPGQPDYSAGRGGSGNITHHGSRTDGAGGLAAEDIVPEPATQGGHYADYHTGRGGEGNIHRDKYGGHSKPQKEHGSGPGLMERAKQAVGLDKHKGEETK